MTGTGAVQAIQGVMTKDVKATELKLMQQRFSSAKMQGHGQRVKEVKEYVTATDTSTTSNSTLGWKNSTTIPVLCHLRDTLHSQYMSILSLDNIDWEAFSFSKEDEEKRRVIKAYMSNKIRNSDFRKVISDLLYDWIDTGNAFATSDYVHDFYHDDETGEKITTYSGPVARRISYYDIDFNPLATNWVSTPKFVRSIVTIGDLHKMVAEQPEAGYLQEAINIAVKMRQDLARFEPADVDKYADITVQGFGSFHEYITSDYVELTHFYGDLYEDQENVYQRKRAITIMDGCHIIRDESIPNWLGKDNIFHCPWRVTPGNLYGMGPLENVVGMQYRIDHLENAKADATDLSILPAMKIRGNVEEFELGPLEEILLGDDGDVEAFKMDLNAIIVSENQTDRYRRMMEEFTGALRENAGIRTPGEKTKFEVQSLAQGSSRTFQEKITDFEVNIVEPLLNAMLEQARRNLDGADVIRVMDDELGVEEFLTITRDDLTAKGKIRAVGARNFAQQAQMVQNYMGFRNLFAADPGVMSHISGLKEAELFEKLLNMEKEELVSKNVRVHEQGETQMLANQVSQGVEQSALNPIEGFPEDA